MNKPRSTVCVGDSLEQVLCATVARLRPLYSQERDAPAGLLRNCPNASRAVEALQALIDTMFPGRFHPSDLQCDELGVFLMRRLSMSWRLLRPEIERALPFRWTGAPGSPEPAPRPDARAESFDLLGAFMKNLPEVRTHLVADVEAAYNGDPAALSHAEVQLAYPGLLAIASHRIAHELYRLDVPIVPRIMSEWTHAATGIDIHPGAQIAPAFFIDHGTGVVIGETAKIGERVKIYQGVTLGAKSFPLDEHGHPIKHIQRHPTVENDVVIYSNATILGGDTVLGHGSTIGGNVFLTHSVPPNSVVTMEHAHVRVKTSSGAPSAESSEGEI